MRPLCFSTVAILLVLIATTLSSAACAQASGADKFFPAEPDPFMGDYVGRWTDDVDVDPAIAAQVIPLGNDTYRVRLVSKLDMRCPVIASVEAKVSRGRIKFESGSIRGEIRNGVITGGRTKGKTKFEMKKVTRLSPTLGAPAPENAVILFDGTNFDAWEDSKGWEVIDDGAMMVTPKGGYLTSKQDFTDLRLHIEFRNSYMPKARGQQRSNSGVFVQEIYETQVLDSYGLEEYYDECGGLYKVSAPHVNACAPPLQWQTYDIDYRAPRFDANGELTDFARITVVHNGQIIQSDQELWWITAYTEEERLKPPPTEPGPIRLQAHGNYIQYRNIWLVDLGEGE